MMSLTVYKVGKVLDSSSYEEEQQAILELQEQGKNVVLDMSACTYVSSAGLRVLLYCYKVAASKKLNFYLVGVSEDVREVMSITGFEHFFEYFDTVEECKLRVE